MIVRPGGGEQADNFAVAADLYDMPLYDLPVPPAEELLDEVRSTRRDIEKVLGGLVRWQTL